MARSSTSPRSGKTKPVKPRPEDWVANKGPQERFLGLTCFEALYGGSAGGGKSDALLIDAIRYVGRGHGVDYKSLLLRRAYPDLKMGLMARSKALYPRLGGSYHETDKVWTFPGGEQVYFGFLENDKDLDRYQGNAFCFIGFDEVNQFDLHQYVYLFSRCRSAHGIRCRIRATTNPGGRTWVFERFGAWLNPLCKAPGTTPRPDGKPPAEPGEILYFLRDEAGVERAVPKGTLDPDGTPAKGRVFVPARLEDNPALAADGAYASALRELDPVTYEQLRNGNWLIQPGKGLYFKRDWFSFVDAAPGALSWVRAWDLAATPKTADNDPDWTVGVKMALLPGGKILVGDVARMRGGPGEVERFLRATAELDGVACRIRLPQDPGQAGKSQAESFYRLLAGYSVHTDRPTGDKITRSGPFSSQASASNVLLVRAPWNAAFVAELEAFPEGAHDDQCFPAGTLVETDAGAVPIERIHVGDRVLTPAGFRKVIAAGLTARAAKTLTIRLKDGRALSATPNHPIFVVGKGFRSVDSLTNDDDVVVWPNASFSTESGSVVTPGRASSLTSATTVLESPIRCGASSHSIRKCGRPPTALSRLDATSTTATGTGTTTRSTTLRASLPPSIDSNTATTPERRSISSISSASGPSLPLGIVQRLASRGIKSRECKAGSVERRRPACAAPAALSTSPSVAMFAQIDARGDCSAPSICDLTRSCAPCAPRRFTHRSPLSGTARARVQCVVDGPLAVEVYNLTVEDEHVYFANGVLVHNCDASADAYRALSAPTLSSGLGNDWTSFKSDRRW